MNKAALIEMLVSLLMKMLTPDLLKKFADMTLDFIEDKVTGTKSTVDDAVVLPVCDMIRASFNIPDND
jgi:hypothetical protein